MRGSSPLPRVGSGPRGGVRSSMGEGPPGGAFSGPGRSAPLEGISSSRFGDVSQDRVDDVGLGDHGDDLHLRPTRRVQEWVDLEDSGSVVGSGYTIRSFGKNLVHYHAERNHQGLGNSIIAPVAGPTRAFGRVRCRE